MLVKYTDSTSIRKLCCLLQTFVAGCTGDNMLTALSVARDCGMVEPHAKVVVAHVTPGTGDKPARVEWKYADSLKHPSSEVRMSLVYNFIYTNSTFTRKLEIINRA